MTSKVEIANQALMEIGDTPINSFDEGSPSANVISQVYDFVARQVMAEGAWSSCTFRASLNKLSETPVFGFNNKFQLPTEPEAIKILSINNEKINDVKYEIEQDKLLIDESAVSVKYIGFLTDPASYGIYLAETIVFALAARIAFRLTGMASVSKLKYQQYFQVLSLNLGKDGAQGSFRTFHSDALTQVR